MNYISYNKEFLTAQAEILRLFSNIIIESRETHQKSIVPCVFGQSSRIFKSIMNPQGAPQIYPIISIERSHFRIDLRRNCEINHDISMMSSPKSYDPNTRPPTPVDIEYILHAFSKYPEELDMIVSNFIPFFNKDVYVTSPHPKLKGKFLNHQVVWNGNVNVDWKTTLQSTEQDIQVATTNFTFKTELFGGSRTLTDNNKGVILKINMSLSPSDGTDYPSFDPSKPNSNILGGFYDVPYSDDFDSYSSHIIKDYIANNGANCDDIMSTAYNAMFNSAVLNGSVKDMEKAFDNGANIFKNSYWAYKYADMNNMTDVKEWLSSHGALIPTDEEHYPSPVSIHVADLDSFSD